METRKKAGKRRVNLSEGAAVVLESARQRAQREAAGSVEPAHLMLALLQDGRIIELVKAVQISPAEAELYVEALLPPASSRAIEPIVAVPPDSQGMERVFGFAAHEAWRFLEKEVSVEHLFLGLLKRQRNSHLSEVMGTLGLHLKGARDLVARRRQASTPYPLGHPLNQTSEAAVKVLKGAQAIARAKFSSRVGTLHLLAALSEEDCPVSELLRSHGQDPSAIHRAALDLISAGNELASPGLRFTPTAQKAIERARALAEAHGREEWSGTHLLCALMSESRFKEIQLTLGLRSRDPARTLLSGFADPQTILQQEQLRGKLSAGTYQLISNARALAAQAGESVVTPWYLFLGLLADEDGLASKALASEGVRFADLRPEVKTVQTRGDYTRLAVDANSTRLLKLAADFAVRCKRIHVGPEHLLVVLVQRDRLGRKLCGPGCEQIAAVLSTLREKAILDYLNEIPIRQAKSKAAKSCFPGNLTFGFILGIFVIKLIIAVLTR